MSILLVGGAGFIGSNLATILLGKGERVVVADNLSRGNLEILTNHFSSDLFDFRNVDISDCDQCAKLFDEYASSEPFSEAWHLAANSDIPTGTLNPDIDFKDTFCSTFQLLKCMRDYGVLKLNFASSSAIYGDLGDSKISENSGPLLPISNYGAMKLASEAICSAAGESFLEFVNIFRFPNVVGVPATHGVILDFFEKLKRTPNQLQVLGNGFQQKAYLHVTDLISAMLFVRENQDNFARINPLNIGPIDEGVQVRWIAERLVERIGRDISIEYGTENRGWVGDVPRFYYSVDKLTKLGWKPSLNSEQAIIKAIDEIAIQEEILSR